MPVQPPRQNGETSTVVLMPSGTNGEYEGGVDESDYVYNEIIVPGVRGAFASSDRTPVIVREVGNSRGGSITSAILRGLVEADIALVDITGWNPNVFFELGIRYALRDKVTIILAQEGTPIPFDIAGYRCVFYNRFRPREAIARLEELVLASIDPLWAADSVVFDVFPSLQVSVPSVGLTHGAETESFEPPTVERYWMGKGINLEAVWRSYDNDPGYIPKVLSTDLHLLRLTFGSPTRRSPLFNHEAIYKTVKGSFHDVKHESLTSLQYDSSVPIFLYQIHRGSGVYDFLAQLNPTLAWIAALGGAAIAYRTMLEKDHDFDEKKMEFIRKYFPNASPEDTAAYLKAWTTFSRRRVLQRLLQQNLEKVEVSKHPVSMDEESEPEVVDMKDIVVLTDAAEGGHSRKSSGS